MTPQQGLLRGNRYSILIERIFANHYREGIEEFIFDRSELVDVAQQEGIALPKNLGDIVYSFRYRAELPESVRSRLPEGWTWLIWPAGSSRYKFIATDRDVVITPNTALPLIKIADSTPGIISKYSLTDEQALLAKLGYCRLLDVFTGITCYRLQSHLRTQVADMGQVETDDVYIGIDKRGANYILPVQAKGKRDKLSIVQVAQDLAMSQKKFPDLLCRAISAQFMLDGSIALFSFENALSGPVPTLIAERHYCLVPHEHLTADDLQVYAERPDEPTI
ncbi:hypothetical protein BH24CHL4_BH24CHL4_00050 [soil metagenome]